MTEKLSYTFVPERSQESMGKSLPGCSRSHVEGSCHLSHKTIPGFDVKVMIVRSVIMLLTVWIPFAL